MKQLGRIISLITILRTLCVWHSRDIYMRFKVIDKRPVLIGSTIHKKKIGQVLEAKRIQKGKKAKRNPHIREPHLQLKGRI